MQDDWVGEGLFVWPSWRGERCSLFQEKRDFEIAFNTRCELREAFLDTWNADIHKAMRGCGKRRIPMEASESSSVFLRVLFEDDIIFPRVSAVEVQRLAHVLTLQSRTEEASVQWKEEERERKRCPLGHVNCCCSICFVSHLGWVWNIGEKGM